ncbi:MAG TPA: hypothetical protein VM115_02815 [Vicinamibacterales bacterium]|nr:hypothetical protein [Vicinamibacterales bacterium]
MTKKTRTFVLAAAAVLFIGLAGGLIAYLAYNRGALVGSGLPDEMRYVPADIALVAFADVKAVMNSELRRALMPSVDPESRKGRQMMNDFAGVDVEKQVDHIVAYVAPYTPKDPQAQDPPDMPRALVMVQGTFDPSRIEAFISERAGKMDEYKGRKIFVRTDEGQDMAVGLVGNNLIAMGQGDLVRGVIDQSQGALLAKNITSNAEMMTLVRDNAGSTAWVVGQFSEISRRMRLPSNVAGQVPPVKLVAVKANINGGVKVAIRAEAGDTAAADQLRDVVRAFISLGRLQAGSKPEFETLLKSVELSGTERTVRLSFALTPEALRAIAPIRGGRGGRGGRGFGRGPAEPPDAPSPPLPPAAPK